MCKCGGKREEVGDRELEVSKGNIKLHTNPPNAQSPNNVVTTYNYTLWNFLPKNLFEQFCNYANLYFLLIGILQIIPATSTTNGIPS